MYSRSLLMGRTGGSETGTVRSSSCSVYPGMPTGMLTVLVGSVPSAAAEKTALETGVVKCDAIVLSPIGPGKDLHRQVNQWSLRLRSGLAGRVERSRKDLGIGAAPAEIAADCIAHVGFGRMRVLLKQRRAGHHHAGRAEAALHRIVAHE